MASSLDDARRMSTTRRKTERMTTKNRMTNCRKNYEKSIQNHEKSFSAAFGHSESFRRRAETLSGRARDAKLGHLERQFGRLGRHVGRLGH